MTPAEAVAKASKEELMALARQVEAQRSVLRRENAITYYQTMNPDALGVHLSTAKVVPVVGGNRSSKTESALAEAVIQATGIVPMSLKNVYPAVKLRAPIRVRIICKSLTNTWEPVIKRKLQWWEWSGDDEQGGPNGHWGWIPKHMLIKGQWDESWSEKYRTLTLTNGSVFQIMSREQDLGDFAGASCHLVVIDEGIDSARYRENLKRTIDCRGRLIIPMTPPDDQAASWDAAWIYELYQRGLPGPGKDPDVDSITLFTEKNRVLPKDEIEKTMKDMSDDQREVAMHGRFLHLSGRIYPNYMDREKYWCFECNKSVMVLDGKQCSTCKSESIVLYCHLIEPFPEAYAWPCIMAVDPHPRKAICFGWYAVSPSDDLIQVAELEIDDTPIEARKAIDDIESRLHLRTYRKIMDPNMGNSPMTISERGLLVREEFDRAGIHCAMAEDNRFTARTRIREYLKPDRRTRQPRLHIFKTCTKSNYQMMHWSWDENASYTSDRRDPKPIPQQKHSDFPTLWGYVLNDNPNFRSIHGSTMTVTSPGEKARRESARRHQPHAHPSIN
mgnify:FL=1